MKTNKILIIIFLSILFFFFIFNKGTKENAKPNVDIWSIHNPYAKKSDSLATICIPMFEELIIDSAFIKRVDSFLADMNMLNDDKIIEIRFIELNTSIRDKNLNYNLNLEGKLFSFKKAGYMRFIRKEDLIQGTSYGLTNFAYDYSFLGSFLGTLHTSDRFYQKTILFIDKIVREDDSGFILLMYVDAS